MIYHRVIMISNSGSGIAWGRDDNRKIFFNENAVRLIDIHKDGPRFVSFNDEWDAIPFTNEICDSSKIFKDMEIKKEKEPCKKKVSRRKSRAA